MSRSGYSDNDDQWALIKWRGQVASAIRGKRGQAFLREMADALDAMPDKRLIAHELGYLNIQRRSYEVCAIGSVGVRRCIQLETLDPEDPDKIADVFGIAAPLVQEIEYINDEAAWNASPERRWQIVRDWVASKVRA